MAICTFFGHHDAPCDIRKCVNDAVVEMVTKRGVDLFLVGDSGGFDRIVKSVLVELAPIYNFEFRVVLSSIPREGDRIEPFSLLPDGIELALPRFRIDFRNKYMLNSSNYVISYVERSYGGAYKYCEIAKRKKLAVFNLAN